jgi:hypothetical protein
MPAAYDLVVLFADYAGHGLLGRRVVRQPLGAVAVRTVIRPPSEFISIVAVWPGSNGNFSGGGEFRCALAGVSFRWSSCEVLEPSGRCALGRTQGERVNGLSAFLFVSLDFSWVLLWRFFGVFLVSRTLPPGPALPSQG